YSQRTLDPPQAKSGLLTSDQGFRGLYIHESRRLLVVILQLEALRFRVVDDVAEGADLGDAGPVRPESDVQQADLGDFLAGIELGFAQPQAFIGNQDHLASGRGDDLAGELEVLRRSRAHPLAVALDPRHQ